ncbi:hypothetical protein MMC29_007840 [Sticta canariensis]|nr:hypothetical protein [Sticta canariensis]
MLLTQKHFCLTTKHSDSFMGRLLDSAPYSNFTRHHAAIADHLAVELPSGGVLQCLDYRIEPRLELVFQISSKLSKQKSLRSLILGDNEDEVERSKPPIPSRISLVIGLVEAILSVHAAKLMHKSIQPEKIFISKTRDQDDTQPGGETSIRVPILTDWRMMRKTHELSSRLGEDDWTKNIYRHPQRQDLQLEKRYHMGHDLYSLDACLLELGSLKTVDLGAKRPLNDTVWEIS